MKCPRWILLLSASLTLATPAADTPLTPLLQGLVQEESNRDLEAAVQAYQLALDQFAEQRKAAATAAFRLAECYRKLGKSAEARPAYQRVLHDFPDQTQWAEASRQALEALPAQPGEPETAAPSADATDDPLGLQKQLLRQELALVQQSLTNAQLRFQKGAGNNAELLTIQRDILSLKRQILEVEAKQQPPRTVAILPAPADFNPEDAQIQRYTELKQNSPDLLEARDSSGRSPLYRAIQDTQDRLAAHLLNQQVNLEAPDKNGNTPLHVAVGRGNRQLVELLLQRGAKVNARNSHNSTPLHLAAGLGFKAIAETLIDHGADLNASSTGGEVCARLDHRFTSLVITPGTPLHNALAQGFHNMVELLVARGANVDPNDPEAGSPLALAAQFGNSDMVQWLLDHGADINGKGDVGKTPLHWAAINGSQEILALLLPRHPNLEQRSLQDLTPLQAAANAGQVGLAVALLKAGANPNVKFEGSGEFHVAHPANRSSLPRDGKTPLHWAVLWGSSALVEALLDAKADVNARDANGLTPLHLARGSPDKTAMKLLLDHHADVNATNSSGATALHAAVETGDKEAVKLLLANGADASIKDAQGYTAVDIIQRSPAVHPPAMPQNSRPSPPISAATRDEIAGLLKNQAPAK